MFHREYTRFENLDDSHDGGSEAFG
jgi:hypothetical protein